jgi:crossover junction endodeoxyribonuclease RuvC
MITLVGIDPGMSGGIAIIRDGDVTSLFPMPVIDKGMNAKAIRDIIHVADFVIMEKASAMPKQGVTGVFHFGEGYGMLQGIVLTLGIPLRLVTPQAWKKEILAGTTKDKAAAIDYVMRVYPSVNLIQPGHRKPHDGICDAVCIAEYGYRTFA